MRSRISGILFLALAAFPSLPIVESYVGGSSVAGHISDGNFFVAPGHGKPPVKVSELAWLSVFWLEKLWPWYAIILLLVGFWFLGRTMSPGQSPSITQKEPWWFYPACFVQVALMWIGGSLTWSVTREVWAVELVVYLLFVSGIGAIVWGWMRWHHWESCGDPSKSP